MGLDISYYSGLTPVACSNDDDCEHIRIRPDEDFGDRMAPLTPGCYEAAEEGDGFRAGSYSGYSAWREALAKLAKFPAAKPLDAYAERCPYSAGAWEFAMGSHPFVELVNFSDCEGAIGSIAAKKLAADFAAHDDEAKRSMSDYEYGKYREWRKAFEMAADNGVVLFH